MTMKLFRLLVSALIALAVVLGVVIGCLELTPASITYIDHGERWEASLGQTNEHDQRPSPDAVAAAPPTATVPKAIPNFSPEGCWAVEGTAGIQLRFKILADGIWVIEELLPSGFHRIGVARREENLILLDVRFHRLDRVEESYPVRALLISSIDGTRLDGTWQALDGQNGGSYRLKRIGALP